MPTRREEQSLRRTMFKKTRKKENLFAVEGERALSELLKSDWKIRQLFAAPQKISKIRALIPFESAWEVKELSAKKMARLTQTESSPGVLALVEKRSYSFEEAAGGKRVLILDNVRDPGNAGTLLRTARSLGWNGVVMLAGTVELYAPKVVRSTAGALFHLKVVEGAEADETLSALKGRQFTIIAADSHSGEKPEELNASLGLALTRLALVVGSEASGVSPAILSNADRVVRIPLSEEAESLNAAVSGGILMYSLRG